MTQATKTTLISSALTGLFFLTGCTSGKPAIPVRDAADSRALPNEPVSPAAASLNECRKWSRQLGAHISHVSSTVDGKHILVSTSGEKKPEARIRLFTKKGKLLWARDQEQPVKSQALSAGLAAVTTYDGKLKVYSTAGGKLLWEQDHLGRPVILEKQRLVVLLNDDDSEPDTAFVTYDFEGNRKAVVKAPHKAGRTTEPLDSYSSEDGNWIIVATSDNAVLVFEPTGKLIAQGKIDAPVVMIAALASPLAKVYALTATGVYGYFIKKETGELLRAWKSPTDRKYEVLRLSHGIKNVVYLYGNTIAGQALTAFDAQKGTPLWKKSYSTPANYSSLAFAGPDYMSVALDDGKQAGILHLMALNASGQSIWDAGVEASEGIYSYALAEGVPALAIGRGEQSNGSLDWVELSPKPCSDASDL